MSLCHSQMLHYIPRLGDYHHSITRRLTHEEFRVDDHKPPQTTGLVGHRNGQAALEEHLSRSRNATPRPSWDGHGNDLKSTSWPNLMLDVGNIFQLDVHVLFMYFKSTDVGNIFQYLKWRCNRSQVIKTGSPLWTWIGRAGAEPLTYPPGSSNMAGKFYPIIKGCFNLKNNYKSIVNWRCSSKPWN